MKSSRKHILFSISEHYCKVLWMVYKVKPYPSTNILVWSGRLVKWTVVTEQACLVCKCVFTKQHGVQQSPFVQQILLNSLLSYLYCTQLQFTCFPLIWLYFVFCDNVSALNCTVLDACWVAQLKTTFSCSNKMEITECGHTSPSMNCVAVTVHRVTWNYCYMRVWMYWTRAYIEICYIISSIDRYSSLHNLWNSQYNKQKSFELTSITTIRSSSKTLCLYFYEKES